MDRKTYRATLHVMLSTGHQLHSDISDLMDELLEGASTHEWKTLMRALETIGTAMSILHNELYPSPSALTDEPASEAWDLAAAAQDGPIDA